jgi:hypothetical protein
VSARRLECVECLSLLDSLLDACSLDLALRVPHGSGTVRYNGRTVISQARTVQAGWIVDKQAHWWRLAHPVSPSLLLILDLILIFVEPGVHALASSFKF